MASTSMATALRSMRGRAVASSLASLLKQSHCNASLLAPSTRSLASISSVLSRATVRAPLKDAVKFMRMEEKSTVWTFRELTSHVDALANGLSELKYNPSDRIVSLLAPHSPEYAVLLLAAAKLRLTLIAVNPSGSLQQDAAQLTAALSEHQPVGLFLPSDVANTTTDDSQDQIVAAVNPLLNELDPSLALKDTAGVAGFVPITGRAFRSPQFPSLRHVVQTSDQNVRSAITFKSLLVYTPSKTASSKSSPASGPLLIDHQSKAQLTEKELIKRAEDIAQKLSLSADHSTKSGRLIVRPEASEEAASASIAALMKQTLWLSPEPEAVEEVTSTEDATVA